MEIVLCRGTEYTTEGVTFYAGQPRTVDDSFGERLVQTRRFRRYTEDVEQSELDAFGLSRKSDVPKMPQNILGLDNLNDKMVLLKRVGAIGDCVFVAQFAQHLKSLYPSVVIVMCVRDTCEKMVSMYDHIDFVISPDEACKHDTVTKFDYIVDFAGVIESGGRVPENCYAEHFKRAGLDMPNNWQVPMCYMDAEGDTSVAAFTNVQRLLSEINCPKSGFIVILRGTSNSMKTWDGKILQRVIDNLSAADENGVRHNVLVLGTSKDRIKTKYLQPFVFDVQDIPIELSCALVAHAAVVIGGDTGLVHFAHSIGIPTVQYCCATGKEFVSNHMNKSVPHAFVSSTIKCHPCNVLRSAMCPNYQEEKPDCSRQLSAQEIADAARALVRPVSNSTHASICPTLRTLNVEEARNSYNGQELNVAFIVDSFNVWSGGAFYTWNLAQSFCKKAGVRVWVIVSDADVAFMHSIPPKENMVVVYDPHRDLLTNPRKQLHFGVVVGTPHKGGMDAVQYAKHNEGVKSVCLIYETPHYIAQYRTGRDTTEDFWDNYRQAMLQADLVLTISGVVKKHLLEWLPGLAGKVEIVSPCVTSTIADSVLPHQKKDKYIPIEKRGDTIVFIARNVGYKKMADALPVIAELFAPSRFSVERPLTIIVIGSNTHFLHTQKINEWAKFGVRVVFHENLSEASKWELLGTAKALVHPSLFEGFGIPIAEALYAATPVICHRLEVFEECFAQHPYYYATDEELVATLHHVFEAWDAPADDPGKSQQKLLGFAADARMFAKKRYSQPQQGSRIMTLFAKYFKQETIAKQRGIISTKTDNGKTLRLAMVTPWNVRCGVAETTKQLLEQMPCTYKVMAPYEQEGVVLDSAIDGPNVVRCFNREFRVTGKLMNELLDFAPSVVHFQHEFSIFRDNEEFFAVIKRLQERGIRTVVTLHTVVDSLFVQQLAGLADALVIARPTPFNPPASKIIPLPIKTAPKVDVANVRAELGIPENAMVIGSFGMWQPFKGYAEFLDTYNDVAIAMQPTPVVYLMSGYAKEKDMYFRAAYRKHKSKLDDGRIILFRDYAPISEVAKRVAITDMMVFYYDKMNHYSASASVREAFANSKPALCSDSAMFSEFKHEEQVYIVQKGTDPTGNLINGILALARNKAMRDRLTEFGARYTSECRASVVAKMTAALYKSLNVK